MEAVEKNNGSEEASRRQLENELIALHRKQKNAHAQQKSNEEIMNIGKRFCEKEAELKTMGGSWKDAMERMEREMWDEIEEKRKKESGHERLAA